MGIKNLFNSLLEKQKKYNEKFKESMEKIKEDANNFKNDLNVNKEEVKKKIEIENKERQAKKINKMATKIKDEKKRAEFERIMNSNPEVTIKKEYKTNTYISEKDRIKKLLRKIEQKESLAVLSVVAHI